MMFLLHVACSFSIVVLDVIDTITIIIVTLPFPYSNLTNNTIIHQIDPMTLNNTVNHPKMTLVFNRVPKVGSQSTMELLRALSYKNGFTFHKDRPQKVENIKLSEREQVRKESVEDSDLLFILRITSI